MIYECPICHKSFKRAEPPVSCAVLHAEGEGCHYGDTEIEVKEKKDG